jgi:hypothetical protein
MQSGKDSYGAVRSTLMPAAAAAAEDKTTSSDSVNIDQAVVAMLMSVA